MRRRQIFGEWLAFVLIVGSIVIGLIGIHPTTQQSSYNIPSSTIAAGTGGNYAVGGNVMVSGQTPTIVGASCFTSGTASTLATGTGSAGGVITVGGTPANTCVITFSPPALNGWIVSCVDITTNSTTQDKCKQTASTTTSATISMFSDVSVASAPVAADKVQFQAVAF